MWVTNRDANETVCPRFTRDGNKTQNCIGMNCAFWITEIAAEPEGRGRCVDVVNAAVAIQAKQSLDKLPETLAIRLAQLFRSAR